MANVYIEARPKGRPEGRTIMSSKIMPITSFAPSKRNEKQLIGPRVTATRRLSLASENLNDKKKPDHWRAA